MADSQLVSVGFGSESFSSSGVKLNSFIITGEFNRALPSKVYPRQGICQKFPASATPTINGALYLDSVLIPDGSVIMVQASHTRFAKPVYDGALFIALSKYAPMIAVKATLPASNEAMMTGSFLVFQGRGYILKQSEFSEYGVNPPKSWRESFLAEDEIEQCYEILELAAGVAKPKVEMVEDADGNTIAIQAKPSRRIRIR